MMVFRSLGRRVLEALGIPVGAFQRQAALRPGVSSVRQPSHVPQLLALAPLASRIKRIKHRIGAAMTEQF
jgi:hypothetical protein